MLKEDAFLPEDILNSLPGRDGVMSHAEPVDGSRWRKALSQRGLPTIEGKLAESDQTTLTRREVFELGEREISVENAFQLLYYSLAWGLGSKGSWMTRRLDDLATQTENAADLLPAAWVSVRDGQSPISSYRVLTTERGAGKIKGLGPAFATKFLYFAEGSTNDPRHLIIDKVVSANLKRDAWPTAPLAAWYPDSYERYCKLLESWAAQASNTLDPSRSVRQDEVEMALFRREP
ncbi:8-oxoguanine DNA glycosylase OGG fold protein [Nesterenkonia sp. DZ6]|uniref:8-oxoguanine DNA glycosylase OGG fold protein n=1 Tax=Nesterenkonia sp. DZ6 TaxID=2901229 RepID=UPI001F4CABD9|nr:hypothetical protein [Nesterenkonia sp. DZ6]MCH8559660.1 hypothetical protein [Nesterenkonia sp. DZ6]